LENWSFERDLNDVLDRTREIWPTLRGANIFITGGTGFIGCWLLESLRYANDHLGLGIRATILTRNPDSFTKKAPHLANYQGFTLLGGDVNTFATPDGEYTHLIHAATDASADLNENDPLQMFNTVLLGTQRALSFAAEKKIPKTLYLSSGAVYGQQSWEMEKVPENWIGAPSCVDARAAYAEGKRAAEMLCAIYASSSA
jgi:nucleoside-diphosphate-sugar epimerase